MRKALLLIASLWLSALAAAQTGVVQNHSFLGGKKAITSGTNSTNYLDGIIPGASITVYLHNTTTKATIYTVTGGPLANPFFSNAATAVDPGGYVFRANLNVGLDVVSSGGGGDAACTIQPNCYLHPVTLLVDVFPNSSVSPIVNPLTIQTNEVGNTSQALLDFKDTATVKATNPSGGIESFNVPDATNSSKGVAQCDGTTTTCTAGVISANPALNIQTNEVNNTSQVLLDFQNSPTVTFRNPSAGIETADVAVSGGIGQFIQPPIAGQYVILTPTAFAKTDAPAVTVTGDLTSADLASGDYCSFPSSGTATWTFTGALEAQYPTLNPANITAVYAAAVGSNRGILPIPTGCLVPMTYNVASFSLTSSATGATGGTIFSTTAAEFESVPATAQLVSLAGANVDTTQIHAGINMSGDFRGASDTTVTGVRLFVYYTGSPVSSPGFIPVNVPLLYSFTNGLSIDPNAAFWGTGLQARQIRELPPASSWTNAIIAVTDGVSNADCTTGGGSTPLQCRSTGSIWTPYSGGGGGGGSVGTAGQMQMAGATSGSFAPSSCTEGSTDIVCTKPIDIPGPPFGFAVDAGTPVAGAAGTVVYASDATVGYAEVNENNTGLSRVCTAANGICNAADKPISRVSCVTYGCVADGNLAGNTGTDNTTPFTSCLTAAIAANDTCYVPAGVYRIATSLPTISVGGTGFVGDIWGFDSPSAVWNGPSTVIFTSSASATILTISSGSSSYITGDHLENIALQSAVTRNTGSIALLMDHAAGAVIKRNTMADSAIGMDLTNVPGYGEGIFEHNAIQWGKSGIACSAGPLIGYNLHGGGGGFFSTRMEWNTAAAEPCPSPTSYGFKADGFLLDLMMAHNETAGTSYGIYFTTSNNVEDVSINDQIDDGNTVQCEHFDFSGTGRSLVLHGGRCETSSGTGGGTELHNVRGVHVSGRQYRDNGGSLPDGVIVNTGSTANAVENNIFYQPNSRGIVCNGANGNNYTGNTFDLAGAASEALDFTNCSNSTIAGNQAHGGTSTVVSMDSSSNNNKYINLQTWESSGTAISDAGTGNQFSGSGGLSGMTASQVPIAATASTVTSSKAILGTDTSLISGTGTFTASTVAIGTSNGGITNATALPNGITATTQSAADNSTKVATTAYVDAHFVASGTSAMGTSAISSGTCATVVTTAATGTATTDVIVYTPNADPTGVTGYAVSATGSLYIWAYPTSGNVNFKVCNNTSGSLTPSALTLNWTVRR